MSLNAKRVLTSVEPDLDPDLPPPPSAPRPFALLTTDILPTGRRAVVQPMKARAERAFMEAVQSKDAMQVFLGWNALILAVCPAIDGQPVTEDVVLALDDADRRAIMLMCRRRTYRDPVVSWSWRCAPPLVSRTLACGHTNDNQGVDIDALTYVPVPEVIEPLTLPVSGKKVSIARPNGFTSKKYLELRKGKDTLDQSQVMLSRGLRFDGKVVSLAELDDLIGEDYAALKKAMVDNYGPDSKVECKCEGCGTENTRHLESIPGFFFPGLGV